MSMRFNPTGETTVDEIAEVWRSSRAAAIRPADLMLVTDFDGTLAEIVADPALSIALPEVLTALQRLVSTLKAVTVLSSRTAEHLERLVPVSGVRLIGDSGRPLPGPDEKPTLERFNHEAAELLQGLTGVWLEMKPASSTVHLRNAQVSGAEVMALLRPLLDATGMKALLGRRVIEVHVPQSSKGSSLARLIDEVRPGGIVCMGDDENDRSVFELVSSLEIPHLCVGVWSAEVPEDLFEHCDVVVGSPQEVASFLTMLADWSEPRAAG